MMRVALTCSKAATTLDLQLSLQGNKRAQNEANGWNPKSSSVGMESPWTADEMNLPAMPRTLMHE
jgi:hypothetical protein